MGANLLTIVKNKSTQKGSLLESIENLNITSLSRHLNDQYPYLGVSKPVVLEGMEDVFRQFQEKGDSLLERHEAICDSRTCSNRGCLGYVFRGNHSGSLLSLLFEEANNVCTDICQCFDFRPLDESIPDGDRILLEFNGANLTRKEVRELVNKVEAALEEVELYKGRKVKWETFQNWLERHENLRIEKLWSLNNDTLLDFTIFSDSLLSLKEYVDLIPTYTAAYKEFTGMEDEKALLKWLVRHHALHIKDMDFGYFDHLTDKNTLRGLKIDKEDFKIIEEFSSLSRKTYWPMLEKYTTFTEDDTPKEDESGNEIPPLPGRPSSSEYWQNRDSLLYHLRKRKMV